MTLQLDQSLRVYQDLKERLMIEYGLADEDPALLDTLEGATDLHERLVILARKAVEAESFAEAVGSIIADNRERKARFERSADKLRNLVAWGMQEAGIPKIAAPDMTLSQRIGPKSLATTIDPESADDRFVITKTEKRFDTKAIRAALEAGEELDWARLNNGAPSLTIRTK